jgi:hypothetical protein
MKRYIKNPFAANLRENGYKVRITRGEGKNKEIVEEYFVSPEEIEDGNKRRREHLREMTVQTRTAVPWGGGT